MSKPADVKLHEDDLPDGLDLGASVAVDTETMGLNPMRDRLCLVQLSAGDGTAHRHQGNAVPSTLRPGDTGPTAPGAVSWNT